MACGTQAVALCRRQTWGKQAVPSFLPPGDSPPLIRQRRSGMEPDRRNTEAWVRPAVLISYMRMRYMVRHLASCPTQLRLDRSRSWYFVDNSTSHPGRLVTAVRAEVSERVTVGVTIKGGRGTLKLFPSSSRAPSLAPRFLIFFFLFPDSFSYLF